MKILKKCKKCKKEYEVINPIDLVQCPLCNNIKVMSPQDFLNSLGVKEPIHGRRFR